MAAAAALGRLADLAEAQDGLVTTRQAGTLEVARRDLARLTNAGRLERIAHGVYRISGAPRPRLLELKAAWLQLAPGVPLDQRSSVDGVVSHSSAAEVYQVGLLDRLEYEFSVPPPRRLRTRRGDVLIRRAPIAADDITWHDQVLVTTPLRLVRDLCAARTDGTHLAGVVADLLAYRLATRDKLADTVAPYGDAYGVTHGGDGFLADLLADAAPR